MQEIKAIGRVVKINTYKSGVNYYRQPFYGLALIECSIEGVATKVLIFLCQKEIYEKALWLFEEKIEGCFTIGKLKPTVLSMEWEFSSNCTSINQYVANEKQAPVALTLFE
jgi:hypothetical protein